MNSMRDEKEMRELDYEALTARCLRVLQHTGWGLDEIVHATGVRVDEEGAVPTAVQLLEVLTSLQEMIEESTTALAKDVHARGVPYRVIADKLHTSVMTTRRRLNPEK